MATCFLFMFFRDKRKSSESVSQWVYQTVLPENERIAAHHKSQLFSIDRNCKYFSIEAQHSMWLTKNTVRFCLCYPLILLKRAFVCSDGAAKSNSVHNPFFVACQVSSLWNETAQLEFFCHSFSIWSDFLFLVLFGRICVCD